MPSVGSTTSVRKKKLKSGSIRYEFQWVNWITVADADGTTDRVREQHTERRHTEKEAETLRKVIIAVHSRGEHYVPGSERPKAGLRNVAMAYSAATSNLQTRRYRIAMMNRMLATLGEAALVSDLTVDALRMVRRTAEADGLKRVDRVVGEVERMWKWAETQEIPGVPRPKRIVGTEVPECAPVYATAVASLADCDAMIAHLAGWHRQVAIILRYTGLRASQVLTLDRSDIDLDAGWLRLRAGARGAKGGRHRVVPIHPALIAELRSWQLPDRGVIFLSRDVRRKGPPAIWTTDTLGEPFTRAWRLASVAEAKWGAPTDDAGGRVHARPTHAFRGALESHLLRNGAGDVGRMITGHATSATHDAYIVAGDPTGSPYWKQMLDALATVPPMSNGAVIGFRGAAPPRRA